MEIKKCKYRVRCELGACGKRADWTIQPARVGIRSSVHICADCLRDIVTIGLQLLASENVSCVQTTVSMAVSLDDNLVVTPASTDGVDASVMSSVATDGESLAVEVGEILACDNTDGSECGGSDGENITLKKSGRSKGSKKSVQMSVDEIISDVAADVTNGEIGEFASNSQLELTIAEFGHITDSTSKGESNA